MKKFLIAAVVLVSMSLQAVAGIVVGITLEFGHKDAQGVCIERGFCRIGVTVGAKAITANINDETGNLDLRFNKSALPADVLDYHFANGVFEAPIDYILPADVCKQLGVDKFTIRAGKYKVTEANGVLLISCVNKVTTSTVIR
jgi:hypothetical protein